MPRKKMPTGLREAIGVPSRKPPINEPQSPTGAPPMPLDLSIPAQAVWIEVVPILLKMRTLSISDGDALAALCEAKALYQMAVADYMANGISITSSQGIKSNPAVTIADAALKQYRALLGEFGLTPASRTKIQVDNPEMESPLSKLLAERQRVRNGDSN